MARSPIYTDRWRDAVRPGVIASAEALVPLLVDKFAPNSVLDVGCGEGWFCRSFADAGVESVIGIDGGYVEPHPDARGGWSFAPADLAHPLTETGRNDLVISLEVAEHLPLSRAESFVADLVALSSAFVVFSAAVPGQGGEGHVNEQWPEFWQSLFASHGMAGSGQLRWSIWNDDRIGWWYRQNLLVFWNPSREGRILDADGCPSVIHPGAWRHHRQCR